MPLPRSLLARRRDGAGSGGVGGGGAEIDAKGAGGDADRTDSTDCADSTDVTDVTDGADCTDSTEGADCADSAECGVDCTDMTDCADNTDGTTDDASDGAGGDGVSVRALGEEVRRKGDARQDDVEGEEREGEEEEEEAAAAAAQDARDGVEVLADHVRVLCSRCVCYTLFLADTCFLI